MNYLHSFIKKTLFGTIPYSACLLFNRESPKKKYYKYISKHGYTHYPYSFARKYLKMGVDAFWDKSKQMPCVYHQGKKLYFPRHFSLQRAIGLYKVLRIEQDRKSAHLYVEDCDELRDKILLDIGAAEGIFALEAADAARRIFLFECDNAWIEALTATFDPYKDKTEIIQKYISRTTNETSLALDDFCKYMYNEPLFLKIDIEGEELNALEGAEQLFQKSTCLDFAICAYHKRNHARYISEFLDKHSCEYKAREGYFYVKHSLRTGLIRGFKSVRDVDNTTP